MISFFDVMAGLFTAQMTVALFLIFGHRGVPWYKRMIAAFGAAGMAICLAALFFAPKSNDPFDTPTVSTTAAIGMLIVNATLAIRLFNYFRSGDTHFSCLGTIGRLIGCVFVAWGVFALATLGIALMIGLTGWLDHIGF